MAFKASQFNIRVEGADFVGVYHSASGNYAILTSDEQVMLARAACESIEDPGRLAAFGVLVEEEVDEIAAIKTVFNRRHSVRAGIGLTIAPTLDCNFGCHYCFETHEKGMMPLVVPDSLVDFASFLAQTDGSPRPLSVTWFGGEPLMAMPVIRRLTQLFLKLVHDGRVSSYKVDSLITNGYGLSPKVSQELLKLQVRRLQITLDGPAEIHDARRTLKRGMSATWEAIVANLKEVPAEIQLAIRMNVDRTNMHGAIPLMEALEQRGLLPRVNVFPAIVEDYTNNARPSENLLLPEEFAEWHHSIVRIARTRRWPLSATVPRPSIRGVCMVDGEFGFVVHPNGTLYRCYAELGNTAGHPVGSVRDRRTWTSLGWAPFQSRDPFDDEECTSCALLPTCMGSCPIIRDINRRLRRKACPPYKYSMDKLVLHSYGNVERLVFDLSPHRTIGAASHAR